MIVFRTKWLIVASASALAVRLFAAPLSGGDAVTIAGKWLSQGAQAETKSPAASRRAVAHGANKRRMRPEGAPTGNVRTCSQAGTNLFHLVALDGGGFVTVSADDSMPPILGFSPSGDLPDADPANPFWSLVGGDVEAVAAGGNVKVRRMGKGHLRRFTVADSTVARSVASMIRSAAANPITSASGLDDLRIEPLVKSEWNQSYVGSKKVFNYYTPNSYVCGCVATAMAQLMRFHTYPTASVKSQTFTCYTNNVAVSLTMKGGTYDWDNMPLVPQTSITDAQREAIGRLCYDAGVAMRMRYNTNANGGSSAIPAFVHAILKDVFGYASAECFPADTTISVEQTKNGILSNLDAGYPVLLGIFGDGDIGHAILADGYGYADGTLYCHLNMGWSGSWDYWYAIPAIPTGNGRFTEVGVVIYNIFPGNPGELVTGRVLDPFGNPVADATVHAQMAYRQTWRSRTIRVTETIETSSSGHYALLVPKSIADSYSCSVSVSADSGEWLSTNSAIVAVKSSRSPTNVDLDNNAWTEGNPLIGNSWGNDLYLAPTNAVAADFTAFSSIGDGFAATFTGTPGARYRVEWTESLSPPAWNTFTSVMIPASGEVSLTLTAPEGVPSRFYRIVSDD